MSKSPKSATAITMVVMHNDAVVQGLSELPYVRDHLHWGVLTIGTGLGNARYTIAKFRKHAPNSGHLCAKKHPRVFPNR